MLKDNIQYLPHEIEHYQYLDSVASESTLFLKRDNSAFPLSSSCDIALFGSGARHTVKGGTGSGDVNSHFFNTIEDELELQGFKITTKKWLDKYSQIKIQTEKDFVNKIKLEAKSKGISVPSYAVGQNPYEVEYDLDISNYPGDASIYVLARTSGECADRRPIKGDIKLTDKEISDIIYLAEHYEKFLLVLNVPGPVDLSPILDKVDNILLLSQLGVVTSSTLVNILLGKTNPSGKLTTSWAKLESYPHYQEFGDRDDTKYLEGIYVGYRYFNSMNISATFPFGFGLSYSSFKHRLVEHEVKDNNVRMKVKVDNTSDVAGKEVIQLYLSRKTKIHNPKEILVAFKKTDVIKGHEYEEIDLEFNLLDFPIYNEEQSRYEISEGQYLLELGNSSVHLTPILKINIEKTIVVKEVMKLESSLNNYDLVINLDLDFSSIKVPEITLDYPSISPIKVNYHDKYEVKIPEFINSLSTDDLINMNLGDYKKGLAGIIGQSCSLVVGGAGETTLKVKEIKTALSMVDGPAGLRLIPAYKLNHKGTFNLAEDSIMKSLKPYLPSFVSKLMSPEKNYKKPGSIVYQYCTALPIATALAQSFNPELLYGCGRLVSEEMKLYDVDIWLAPGMNIHRHILCGRNFEYYSEDPYLTGVMAASLVKGVQSLEGRYTTIKHYLGNNQEYNRYNSNSIISARAIREIYLPGFIYVLKHAHPASLMTCYNLVNGVHVSSHKDLLIHILRDECQYDGLIMTDWLATGQISDKSSKYPAKRASEDLVNGVNICMPGNKKDVKDIKIALKENKISLDDLRNNAAVLYNYLK